MTSYKVKKYLKEDIVAEVPGSKSMTNRALLLAAMADGTSRLEGAAFSEDSVHFLKALESMGFKVEADEKRCTVIIEGHGGNIPNKLPGYMWAVQELRQGFLRLLRQWGMASMCLIRQTR